MHKSTEGGHSKRACRPSSTKNPQEQSNKWRNIRSHGEGQKDSLRQTDFLTARSITFNQDPKGRESLSLEFNKISKSGSHPSTRTRQRRSTHTYIYICTNKYI